MQIVETDNEYIIQRSDGLAFLQRKHQRSASETPMWTNEEVICELCKHIVDSLPLPAPQGDAQ